MKFHVFIKKLQALSETKKKIILVVIVGIFAVVLGFFWIKSAAYNISRISDSLKSIALPNVLPPGADNILSGANNVASPSNQGAIGNASSQPIPTADWKTYTNTQYGFEIAYPKDWFMRSALRSDTSEDIYISPESSQDNFVFIGSALNINVSKIKTGNSLLDEVRDRFGKLGTDFTEENIKVGGIDGLIIKTICQGVGCGQPERVVVKNNYFYDLIERNINPVFDQVISTFKFTN